SERLHSLPGIEPAEPFHERGRHQLAGPRGGERSFEDCCPAIAGAPRAARARDGPAPGTDGGVAIQGAFAVAPMIVVCESEIGPGLDARRPGPDIQRPI